MDNLFRFIRLFRFYAATDSWSSENSWDVTDASGAVLASGGPSSGTIGNGCAIAGCTDAAASNYDPLATVDDGSCTYPCTLDEVTLTLYDSYGDGGGSITVDGTTYTLLSEVQIFGQFV